MFKSRLSATAYPCILDLNEVKKYVTFQAGIDPSAIDPVFLGRFAAMCRDLKIKGHITSGFRDHKKQIQLYTATGGKQDAKGEWYGGSPKVAKPGRSWHEFRLAIDTSTMAIKAIDKTAATDNQTTLRKYGLYKPLTAGNKTGVYEDWHIQPIETRNVTDKASLQPYTEDPATPMLKFKDKGEAVKELQKLLVKKGYALVVDGDFGPTTKHMVETFQRAHKLTPDGIVGVQTWKELRE